MKIELISSLALTALGMVSIVGCPDSSPVEQGSGGATSSSTKSSNQALSSVGVGGQNQGGGGSAGEGGTPPNACEQACEKFDNCAGSADRCDAVGVDCSANPVHPVPNVVCILDCIGRADSTCTDIGDYFNGTGLPGPGSKFIQCVSTCNDPPAQGNGTFGGTGLFACLDCLTGANQTGAGGGGGGMAGPGYCLDNIACNGNQDCTDWLSCAGGCGEPTCFRNCDTTHTNASSFYDPFYQCECNDIPPGETVMLLFGEARCWDVCAGLMDPCGA